MVCHEDVSHTQHPHYYDLVLETDHPNEQTTGAAGEVSSFLNCASIVLLYFLTENQVGRLMSFQTVGGCHFI